LLLGLAFWIKKSLDPDSSGKVDPDADSNPDKDPDPGKAGSQKGHQKSIFF
jgi:hypothetical protein